jgi:hypothetical protein
MRAAHVPDVSGRVGCDIRYADCVFFLRQERTAMVGLTASTRSSFSIKASSSSPRSCQHLCVSQTRTSGRVFSVWRPVVGIPQSSSCPPRCFKFLITFVHNSKTSACSLNSPLQSIESIHVSEMKQTLSAAAICAMRISPHTGKE